GPAEAAVRVVTHVRRPLRPDNLVRSLWLLVAGAAPAPEPPEAEDGGEAEAGQPGSERRSCERLPCALTPRCYPLAAAPGERWAGRLCDVSASGVRVFVDRPLEPGTVLVL